MSFLRQLKRSTKHLQIEIRSFKIFILELTVQHFLVILIPTIYIDLPFITEILSCSAFCRSVFYDFLFILLNENLYNIFIIHIVQNIFIYIYRNSESKCYVNILNFIFTSAKYLSHACFRLFKHFALLLMFMTEDGQFPIKTVGSY